MFSSRSLQSISSFTPTSKSSSTSGAASAACATVLIDCSVLPIIMTTFGSLTEDSSTSSSAGFGPDLTFRSFWRLGWTFVSASMHRFRQATSASSGTEIENCFPCHLTATVILPSSAISPVSLRSRVFKFKLFCACRVSQLSARGRRHLRRLFQSRQRRRSR